MSTATYPEPTVARPLRDIITILVVLAVALVAGVALLGERDVPAPAVSSLRSEASLDAESRRLEALAAYWSSRGAPGATDDAETTGTGGPRSEAALDAETRRLEGLAARWAEGPAASGER